MGNETLYYYVKLNSTGDKWKRLNFVWGKHVDPKEVVEAAKRESEYVMSAWLGTDFSGHETGYASWFYAEYAIDYGSEFEERNPILASKARMYESLVPVMVDGVTYPGKMIRIREVGGNTSGTDITEAYSKASNIKIYECKDFSQVAVWSNVLKDMKSVDKGLLRAEQEDAVAAGEILSLNVETRPEVILEKAVAEIGKTHQTYVALDTSSVYFGKNMKSSWPASEVIKWLNPSVPENRFKIYNAFNSGKSLAEANLHASSLSDLSQGVSRKVLRPLTFLSSHELARLRADIAKLKGEIDESGSIGVIASAATAIPDVGPIIGAGYAVYGFWNYFNQSPESIRSVVLPELGLDNQKYSFITTGYSLLYPESFAASKALPALGVATNIAYVSLADGYLNTIDAEVEKQQRLTLVDEEKGEPEDLKWMVWRETLFAKKAWEIYHSKVNELFKSSFYKNPNDPRIKEYKVPFDDYANKNEYESVRLVNETLLKVYGGSYVGDMPYKGDNLVGKNEGEIYSYEEDVLIPYLEFPLALKEVLGGDRYVKEKDPWLLPSKEELRLRTIPPADKTKMSPLRIGFDRFEFNQNFGVGYPLNESALQPELKYSQPEPSLIEEDQNFAPGTRPPETSLENPFQNSDIFSTGTTGRFGSSHGEENPFLKQGALNLYYSPINTGKTELDINFESNDSYLHPEYDTKQFYEPDASQFNSRQFNLFESKVGTGFNIGIPVNPALDFQSIFKAPQKSPGIGIGGYKRTSLLMAPNNSVSSADVLPGYLISRKPEDDNKDAKKTSSIEAEVIKIFRKVETSVA